MAKGNAEKKVVGALPSPPQKAVKEAQQKEGYDTFYFAWQFSEMDLDGPWRFCRLKSRTWADILSKMKHYETMTWAQVKGDRDHSIEVVRLCRKAKERLQEIEKDDIDEVFSIHLDGIKRVIGLRDQNVFKLLWWDPNHGVCPSKPKHT